jgi:hypothetical protein
VDRSVDNHGVKPCILAVLLACLSVPAGAQVRVQVLDMDPAAAATLGHWEQFSLRIEYETDRPIRVRAEALLAGERVTSINGGSPRYEPGLGDALCWFAYTEPARIDTVIVTAVDEETGAVVATTERSVGVTWTGRRNSRPRARAAWVERLQAAQDARARAPREAAANEPDSPLESFWLAGIMWSVPAYFLLQMLALWRLRGRWRIAAIVPAVPMAAIVTHACLAFLAQSNLFPLFLLFASPPASLYLAFLLVVHWIGRGR